VLRDRYHRAIELMDAKLAAFYDAARGAGLLDDTMLVVLADHGEAFGEHELYFHDASVYQTHLHVPLWMHVPGRAAATVDDVVSTRDLYDLLSAVAEGRQTGGTLLDADARAAAPVALAEHFHYPHVPQIQARYAQDIAAAIVRRWKAIIRREGLFVYDLVSDPEELTPEATDISDFAARCRRDGAPAAAVATAIQHLQRWGADDAPQRPGPRRGEAASRLS